jgi:rare lipoprotein A
VVDGYPAKRPSALWAKRAAALAVCGLWGLACGAAPAEPQRSGDAHAPLDLSGRKRVGKASVYAADLKDRKMADGTPMNPEGNNAASKTLPLGTQAKVTNLDTGKSAVVTIRDRGPYVPGRIVDLSPATAKKIGMTHRQGVAKVAVVPISVPPPAAPDHPL